MIPKDKRTIENYMVIGAFMRLFRTLFLLAGFNVQRMLNKKNADRFFKFEQDLEIDNICECFIEQLLADHPEVTRDHAKRMFYGVTCNMPKDHVDRAMNAVAKELTEELFYKER